jgi:hypothetical protein
VVPQAPYQATQASQMAPLATLGAIFGLTLVLVIGAFAAKLYGPDRVRKWMNRLQPRKPPI